MARLDISCARRKLKSVQLADNIFRIGRNEENDLVLADQTVSRFHASIQVRAELGFFEIENLSTTNPLFHNGRELHRPTMLFDHDIIEIGVYRLYFIES